MIARRPTSVTEWVAYTVIGCVALIAVAFVTLLFAVVLHWLDSLFAHLLGA